MNNWFASPPTEQRSPEPSPQGLKPLILRDLAARLEAVPFHGGSEGIYETAKKPLPRVADVLQKSFLLQVLSDLGQIVGPAKIAPIVFVCPEGKDSFSLGSETQIGDRIEFIEEGHLATGQNLTEAEVSTSS